MIQFQENAQTDGQTDRPYFIRTLPAIAGVKIHVKLRMIAYLRTITVFPVGTEQPLRKIVSESKAKSSR